MIRADENRRNVVPVDEPFEAHVVEKVNCQKQGFLRKVVNDRPLDEKLDGLDPNVWIGPALSKPVSGQHLRVLV